MLNLLLIILAVPVVAFIGLATFSFVAGLLTPLATPSVAEDHEERSLQTSHAPRQGNQLPSEGRELATSVVTTFVGFGLFLLVLTGLILLLRSWGM